MDQNERKKLAEKLIEDEVASGKITQAQADEILQNLNRRLEIANKLRAEGNAEELAAFLEKSQSAPSNIRYRVDTPKEPGQPLEATAIIEHPTENQLRWMTFLYRHGLPKDGAD